MKQHSQSCTTFKPSADSPKQANTQPKLLHPDDICVYIYNDDGDGDNISHAAPLFVFSWLCTYVNKRSSGSASLHESNSGPGVNASARSAILSLELSNVMMCLRMRTSLGSVFPMFSLARK